MTGFDLSSLLLLGQNAPPGGGSPGGFFVIIMLTMLGAFVIVVGVPVWMASRAETRKREMEHLERMKAIELGQPFLADQPQESPPQESSQPWWTPARVAVAIGAGVPIGTFALSWLAVLTSNAPGEFVYPCAAGVSVTAIICGTILAARLSWATEPDPHAKPRFDAEAYDVSGHHS